MTAAARSPATGEEPVRAPQRDRPDAVLDPVFVDGQHRVIEVARERCPAFETAVDGPGCGGTIGHLLPVQREPAVQDIGHPLGLAMPGPQPLLRRHLPPLKSTKTSLVRPT